MIATTYQTAILLLFNDSQRLTFSNIKTQLNFSEEEAVGLLYSLACAKYKILVKHPYNTTVGTTDYFEINSKFSVRNGTVKLPMPPIDEKKKAPKESIYIERCFVIDAAIVRIMKAKKVLPHKQLLIECTGQLKFKVDYEEIKRRIEDLIGKEYLERDSPQIDMLRYIP